MLPGLPGHRRHLAIGEHGPVLRGDGTVIGGL
jgi:hypothetical protein